MIGDEMIRHIVKLKSHVEIMRNRARQGPGVCGRGKWNFTQIADLPPDPQSCFAEAKPNSS